jgi:acetyl esterase/lipase
MKKCSITLSFVIALIFSLHAQSEQYILLNDVPYYDSLSAADDYVQERCKLDVYYPANKTNFATLVWFHGGGLSGGEKEIPERLKNNGIAIVAPNYRLSPRVLSPTYIQDAAAAVAWVIKNIKSFGGNPAHVFLSGHSAGAYLDLMLLLDKQWLMQYGVDANIIAGAIPLSGHTITHFTVRKERGLSETKIVVDSMAPIFHIRADAPPILLITGDRNMELLGRYEENAYLMRMMTIVGHKQTHILELQGYDHGMVEPALPLVLREVFRVVEIQK